MKVWIIYAYNEPEDAPILASANSEQSLKTDCKDFPEGFVYQYDVGTADALTNETYLGRAQDIR